jgi:ribosome biogenesis GTPase / thiamine phosphate phosphatase
VLLEQFGWNSFFVSQEWSGTPGRIASANRERFLVWTESGEVDAGIGGHLRHDSVTWPAIGDWVALRGNNIPVIDHVFKRQTTLARKQPGKQMREQVLAANVNLLFIVTAFDRDYNPRRLERYLILARQSGARAAIVLNKSDRADELAIDIRTIIDQTQQLSPETPVIALSALTRDSLEALTTLLSPGETAALIGSSGVGKSTILNQLLGDSRQRTLPIRSTDQRGRHSTTSRELFLMPGGWLLMDLPGLRELQLWADPEQIDQSFDDIQTLATQCRFRDCTHTREPGCAVQNAHLDPGRMENYRKLQRELAYLDRQLDGRLAREERQRWKAIEKSVRRDHPKRQPQ